MGLCQRDIRNSHIAYNRTLYLYFLDTKFKLLRICCSQLYSEETIVFLCWRPCWAHFGRSGAITPVNNVRLSWNFDHKESSLLYKCHLKSFENLKFLQRQDIPKIWAFGPTLTPIYPQKMAKIRYQNYLLSIFNENYNFLMHCLGFFSGTNGPRVNDQDVTAQVNSTFSKAPY